MHILISKSIKEIKYPSINMLKKQVFFINHDFNINIIYYNTLLKLIFLKWNHLINLNLNDYII